MAIGLSSYEGMVLLVKTNYMDAFLLTISH